ncbi:MAG: VCBS repeat-containing protein, partial [Verrucomicrobiales bacterium]|nr:VCBS repeat-containing protein [Verrucomicrobiales bacterium]
RLLNQPKAFSIYTSILILAGWQLPLVAVAQSAEKKPAPPRPHGGLIEKADPTNDTAWSTESFSQLAQQQLNTIAAQLKHTTPTAQLPLDSITSQNFSTTSLRPNHLSTVFDDHSFAVRRWSKPENNPPVSTKLSAVVSDLDTHLSSRPGKSAAKIKIVRVTPSPKNISTLVFFETSRAGLQLNATWNTTWLPAPDNTAPPLLVSIELLSYEETESKLTPGTPSFTDCTEALFGHLDAYNNQLAYSTNHWYGNLDAAFGSNQGNQGLAIGDVNGDGLEDLYLCQPEGLPNRLFVRSADGSLIDYSASSGLDILDVCRAALLIDLDNDGDQDFVIGHRYSLSIYANDGTGKFTNRATIDIFSRVSGVSAADYDNDGDLDLYACGYNPKGQMGPNDIFANPVPYHDANNGALNYLIRNDTNFSFADATKQATLDHNNTRYSFSAAWEDFDNDGDQDLYVANDFGRNNLYRNNLTESGKPTFTDIASVAAVEDVAAGMSANWGDYNNDGLMDVYISNMWSSAGNRVTFQRQFKPGTDTETKNLIQRHARGNSLFQNPGGSTLPFNDVSTESAVTMGRWAWGSLFVDLNNDGWEDLYVANGFMTAPQSGDL